MIISTPIGCTRVIGKAQRYLGLPLRDDVTIDPTTGQTVATLTSAWEPTPAELVALQAGAKILVTLYGAAHPPIMLTVGEVPE